MSLPTMLAQLRSTGPRSVELRIYDRIGKDADGKGVDSESIAAQLSNAGPVDLIQVRINSVGGSAFDGIAICNLLKNHPAGVAVRIDGLAASAASLIAMAGDKIEMALGSMMLIHDPTAAVSGNAKRLRSTAEMLDRVAASAVEIYAAKTRQPADKIAALMEAETWLSATEAKELRFTDAIVSTPAVAACLDLSAFGNVPQAVASLAVSAGIRPSRPVTNAGSLPLADVARYTDAFGPVNGIAWLKEGRDFAECQTLELQRLRSELATIEERQAAEVERERQPAPAPASPAPKPAVRGLASLVRFGAPA